MSHALPTFLPGTFDVSRGIPADYRALESFHYLPRRPATWAGVWVVRFTPDPGVSRLVAVGVLSWPVPTSVAREAFFHLRGRSYRERLQFANRHLRTISRVVVHPQFRSLGLASLIVRRMCEHCPTRYTEAMAVMSQVHPLFEAGGMTRVGSSSPDAPDYFIHDRQPDEPLPVG